MTRRPAPVALLIVVILVGILTACEEGPGTTSHPVDQESTPAVEPESTPAVEPESTPVEPSIAVPDDIDSLRLWMEFRSTEVSGCSGSIVKCSCSLLDPTCTERNRRCERVTKSEYYLSLLWRRYIFDSEALRHPDVYLTIGGRHRVWKYWTYDPRSGAAAVLRINQPGWWFGVGGAKWVPHIDLVHRITFERRVEGLFPHYEGVLVLEATALQEPCNLRINAIFQLYD